MKIETSKLQDLVGKAIKGSSRVPILALTMFIGIESSKGDLILTTTDKMNVLKVIGKGLTKGQEDFYTCVDSELFNKLVSKTTSDEICLEVDDKCLTFKGNGVYSLPIAVDERNNVVKIPDIEFKAKIDAQEVEASRLKDMLNYNKPSIAKTMEVPCNTGYYADDEAVISYNLVTACINKKPIIKGAALLPANLVDLFSIITVEKVYISIDDKKIKVEAGDVVINGALMETIDQYPAKALKGLIEQQFDSSCTIDKTQLLNALDRLSLFISDNEKNAIRLSFGQDNLTISSKKSNGNELIKFIESENPQPFTQLIDISDLKNQLQTQAADKVNLLFGNETGLMLKTADVIELIPYMEDEE